MVDLRPAHVVVKMLMISDDIQFEVQGNDFLCSKNVSRTVRIDWYGQSETISSKKIDMRVMGLLIRPIIT